MHEIKTLGEVVLPYLGIVGTLIGCTLTFYVMSARQRKRDQRERYLELTKRQLEEFYGPMLAMFSDIKTRKEVFRTLKEGAGEEYLQLKKQREFRRAEKVNLDRQYLTQKESERFRSNDLPVLRDMHLLFRTKGWLAENSTRGLMTTMMPLLEIWELTADRPIELKVFEQTLDQNKFLEDLEADLTANQDRLLGNYQEGLIDSLNYTVKVLRSAEPPVINAIPVEAVAEPVEII
jgi:hypothetical protein